MLAYNGRKDGDSELMGFAQQQSFIHAAMLKADNKHTGVRVTEFNGIKVRSVIIDGNRSLYVEGEKLVQLPLYTYFPLDYYSGMVFGGNLSIKSELELALAEGEAKEPPRKVVAKLYSFYPDADTVKKWPPHELTAKELTQEAADRTWYDGFTTKWVPLPVTKLAVKVYNGLEDMSDTAPLKYTGQASTYSHIRPTMFTGSMRKVVQFVMGIGKVLYPTIYPGTNSSEKMDSVEHFTDRDKFNEAADGDGAVQLRYDFRFGNCYNVYQEKTTVEGVSVTKWWLVRVSHPLGVIAMPLPLDHLTTVTAFRTMLEKQKGVVPEVFPTASDLKVLDTFGGFPTGETFEPQVEAFIRAGQYLRLAKVEDLDDYTSATVWGDQIGWSFSYDGKLAKCVAYQDIDVAALKVCRAVRDMKIEFEIKTDTAYVLGPLASTCAGAMQRFLPTGDNAKLWHQPKLLRLSEADATILLKDIEQAGTDPDKATAILDKFEMMVATPIGTGSAKLTTGGKWAFTPATQLFKTANLPYDMCPSVNNWPPTPTTVLVDYGDYRAPAKGSKVPLYRWFTEDGREMAIWYGGDAERTYTTHSGGNRTTVTYTSRAGACWVDKQPAESIAKDIYSDPYTEYKSGGQHHTTMGTSAANDITPEGYVRTDWLLRKYVNGKNDGGPDKADIEYGSAYMVFGDAEAAAEFNYHHHPSTPPWTTTYDRTTTGNSFSYDWNYNTGNIYTYTHKIVECWNLNGGYPSYCSRPAEDITGVVPDEWRNPLDYPINKFVVGVVDGHWAKKGDVAAFFGGVPAPEIPANENFTGTSAWSTMTTRIYAGSEVVSSYVDETYVPRAQAWFDILELQKSLYDPPPESPFIEHDVRGSRNSFGLSSGGYMRAVNDYTYTIIGTELHSAQGGDTPAYIGVILSP